MPTGVYLRSKPAWNKGVSMKALGKSRPVVAKLTIFCKECGQFAVRFVAHHIKPWISFPELRFVGANGITLCHPCHKIAHSILRLKGL
jgi:thymidine kinase